MAEELTLGTIFTGRVDESFRKAATDLRNLLNSLNRASSAATGSVTANVGRAGTEMDNFGKKISKVSGGFQRLTAAMKVTFAYGLAYKAISTVTGALSGAVTAIFDYDQALKNLQAITTATDAETAAMGATIKQVASDSKYSMKEVADAAVVLGQAGFTASETIASLRAVVELSTATLSDTTKVADLMTTAIRAFDEEASESGRIVDIFASAVNKSKLTIEKLRTAFNYLGPIAKMAGLSLEETAAGAMILANAGLRASTIGTGFRQVLSRLVNPSQKLRLIFKATGADMEKLNPATATFSEILTELEKILGKSVDTATRSQRAFQMFGLRGAAVAAAFAQAGAIGFETMMREVLKVGTAADMAATQTEGLGVMADRLRQKVGLLAISIGEGGIAGAFRLLLSVLQPVVDILSLVASTMGGKFVVAVTALTALLLLLRISLKYMIVQLSALALGYDIATVKTMILATHQNTLTVAMAATTAAARTLWTAIKMNPFIAIAAGIAVVITGLFTWMRHTRQQDENLKELIITTNAQIGNLVKYKEKLQDNTASQQVHSNTMQRLIREYPQLAEAVDLTTGKFKDNGEALESLIRKHKELALLAVVDLARSSSKRIQSLKNEKEAITGFFGEMADPELFKKVNDQMEKESEELSIYLRDVAEGLKMYGITSASSIEDVTKRLVTTLKVSTRDASGYAKSIIEYYKAMEAAQKSAVVPLKKMVDDQLMLLKELDKQYGLSFVKLYKSLSLPRQAELLMDLDKLYTKITKMAEAAQMIGLTTPQIDALIKNQYQEFFKAFVRKESDKEKVMRETFDAMAEDLLKFAGKEQEVEEKRAAIARSARDAKINIWEDEKKRATALAESEKVYKAELIDIDKKYFNKRMALYSELSDIYAKNIDDREAKELQESFNSFRILKEKANNEIKEQKTLSEFLIMLEGAEKEERLRIVTAFEEARKKEKEKAEKDLLRPFLREGKEEERHNKRASKQEKELVKLRLENSRKWLANHVKTTEEYIEILDEAYGQNLLSLEEYTERKRAVDSTWLEQLRFGMAKARVDMQTWGEFIIDVGKNIADQIADNLTGAIFEFIDGTKSAGEAFRDFAIDTLNWLSKMIMRQLLLNAIQGIVSSISIPTTAPAPAVAGAGPTSPINRAEGGWINEPVVGMGVRSKRTYNIAENGPEYVNKGGSPPTGAVKVIINNNTGVEAKATSEASADPQGMIVTVWLDALNRNKMSLRDNVQALAKGM